MILISLADFLKYVKIRIDNRYDDRIVSNVKQDFSLIFVT